MKNVNAVIFSIKDLISESSDKKLPDLRISDLTLENKIAGERTDVAIYSNGFNFVILKDRVGLGYIGFGKL